MKGATKAYRFQSQVRTEGRVDENFEQKISKKMLTGGITSSVGKGGKVRPVIDTIRTLEQISDAHSLLESGKHLGKVVLTI